MIQHLQEFVPYDIALKLRKLGYSNQTQCYYNIYNKHIFFCENYLHSEAIWAPNYEQVLDWLRIVRKKEINPTKEAIIETINKISLEL